MNTVERIEARQTGESTVSERKLEADNISHRFGLTDVLDQVSFTLAAGESAALVGPSGCGKTTLLHIVAGLLQQEKGKIHNQFQQPVVMFQEPRLLPWKRAADNIALGLKARGMARQQRQEQVLKTARQLGLQEGDLEKFPYELSGGMAQRVSLARALVMNPDLLLLDEPFSALDIGLREELQDLLVEHIENKQIAVLIVTHELMEAVRICDEIILLAPNPGRIVYRHQITIPRQERPRDVTFSETARLLQHPLVAATFGVKA